MLIFEITFRGFKKPEDVENPAEEEEEEEYDDDGGDQDDEAAPKSKKARQFSVRCDEAERRESLGGALFGFAARF